MEHKFTKLSIALITLGLSTATFAAAYTAPAPAPAAESGYHIGIEGLYVKEHNHADSLRYVSTSTNSGSLVTVNNFVAKPDWQWGFRAEAGYHDGDGNDYTLDWAHLDNKRKTVSTGTQSSAFTLAHNSTAQDFARAVTKYDHDQVDLAFGHTFDPHNNFTFRVHAGAEYARINHTLDAVSDLTSATASSALSYNQTSKFDGVGIRTGADMNWDLGNDFGIFARGAVGLLWGDVKASAFADANNSSGSNATTRIVTTEKQTSIVPQLQGEAGIAWSHDNWAIRGGWRHNVMVNAIKYIDPASTGASVGETSNFAYGGAFLGVEWHSA